jgi:hypothetical protein
VCLRCVVRVESIGQDSTMSLEGESCRGVCSRHPYERYLWRIHCEVYGDPGAEGLRGAKPRVGGALRHRVWRAPMRR